ncbi:MAG: demethoxyubiquinone hydroxylase family protein [Caulobacteraceae bacterium]
MTTPPLPPLPCPGGASRRRAEILRVDHAGELGAVYIYRGQRAVMGVAAGREAIAGQLAEMEAHEARHLARFETLLTASRVRPTLLAPLWRAAGFALGAGTALMGEKAAHACTEAVESVIEAHYAGQIAELGEREPGLAAELAVFRDEELAHRDQAVAAGARQARGYPILAGVIAAGCRAAIALSEKL